MSFQPPDPVQAIDKSGLDHKVHHANESTAEDTQQNHNVMTAAEEFSLELPHTIPDDKDSTTICAQDELIQLHYRLNHLFFKRMFKMAKQGLLPKKILKANVPICPACQYGKMHRKPWRMKGKPSNPSRVATEPGQIVSVDQLESPTPGFIAQLKGTLTKQCYKYATVFVDQYSRLSYVHLQRTITSDETVQAKIAFERYSKEKGVHIQHYHADNGRVADKGFINNCQLNNQCLTYCGVNAHFQNGIAEKQIRDLQETTRTSLLYALHKWPHMRSVHLWPYAMRTANEIMISTPTKYSDKSPQELFSGVNVLPKIKHFHTFACPTYVLDNVLQGQHYLTKWKERARLGVYLGPSPNHSRTISS